ncbi:MAG: hypothetical protein M3Z05_20730 [Gemmatimonadota bacterium]|nr:hypothetical protein [Gemmatimonadota bacterium]
MRDLPCGDPRIYLEFDLRRVDCRVCDGVKREQLDWLAANPHYTKRYALFVGKQCRSASIKEVALDLRMDWHAVKEMDKLYMREQLVAAGTQLRHATAARRDRHRRDLDSQRARLLSPIV